MDSDKTTSCPETYETRTWKELTRHRRWILGGILFIALAIRLLHLHQSYAKDPYIKFPSVDARVYHEWALNISSGKIIGDSEFFNSPLYPYFLASIYALSGGCMTAARLVQILMGVMVCLMVYLLGKRLFSPFTGILACFAAALYSMFIFYESTLLITNIQTPLCLLLLLLLEKIRDGGQRRFMYESAAGLVFGLCILARPNVFLFAPFAVGWLIFFPQFRGLKKSILPVVLFLGCTGIVLLPVVVRNYLVLGETVLVNTQGGVNFYIGNNPHATGYYGIPPVIPRHAGDHPEKQRKEFRRLAEERTGRSLTPEESSDYWYGQGMKFIIEHPGKWLLLECRKLLQLINHYEIPNNRNFYFSRKFSRVLRLPLFNFRTIAPLAFIGIALSLTQWRRNIHVLGFLAAYSASLLLFFNLSRYRMPMIPVLIIFAAYAVSSGISMYMDGQKRKILAMLCAFPVLFVIVNIDLTKPNLSMAHFNMGNKYFKLGRYEDARNQYIESLRIDSGYILAYRNYALVCERDPKYFGEAFEAWNKVNELAERSADGKLAGEAREHLDVLAEVLKFLKKKNGEEREDD